MESSSTWLPLAVTSLDVDATNYKTEWLYNESAIGVLWPNGVATHQLPALVAYDMSSAGWKVSAFECPFSGTHIFTQSMHLQTDLKSGLHEVYTLVVVAMH